MLKINLLPTEQKERLATESRYRNIISSGFILFLLTLLSIIISAGFLIFLHFKYQDIENKITVEQSKVIQTETVKGMEKKVNELNRELIEIRNLQDKKDGLYTIIDIVSRDILNGVRVYSLNIDRDSQIVIVSGFSSTRENLLAIKNKLETDPRYKNVDFPLSNLANPKDINFRFSFTYVP